MRFTILNMTTGRTRDVEISNEVASDPVLLEEHVKQTIEEDEDLLEDEDYY